MSGFARPSDARSPASSEHARPTQSLRGDRGAPNDAAAQRWAKDEAERTARLEAETLKRALAAATMEKDELFEHK